MKIDDIETIEDVKCYLACHADWCVNLERRLKDYDPNFPRDGEVYRRETPTVEPMTDDERAGKHYIDRHIRLDIYDCFKEYILYLERQVKKFEAK